MVASPPATTVILLLALASAARSRGERTPAREKAAEEAAASAHRSGADLHMQLTSYVKDVDCDGGAIGEGWSVRALDRPDLEARDPWTALKAGQPPDVVAFLDRLETCHHFAGEEPYDEARRAEILAALERAGCARLDADEKQLRTSYANVPAVLEALDRARKLAR